MSLREKLQQVIIEKSAIAEAEKARARAVNEAKGRGLELLESLQKNAEKDVPHIFPLLQEVNVFFLKKKGKLTTERIGYLGEPNSAGMAVALEWDRTGDTNTGSARRIEIYVDGKRNIRVVLGRGKVFESDVDGYNRLIRDTNLADSDWKDKVEDLIIKGLRKDDCYYDWEPEPSY